MEAQLEKHHFPALNVYFIHGALFMVSKKTSGDADVF